MGTEVSGGGLTVMAQAMTASVVRQLGTLFECGSTAGLSDRQLIERFVIGRDSLAAEAAFAALVERHGPMVLGLCRRLLHDRQHAEDAFQVVFLVLARRARLVRDPDLLSHWLYGADRLADGPQGRGWSQLDFVRARRTGPRDHRLEACLDRRPADQAADRAAKRDRGSPACGDRPPAPRRRGLPVVLCYLEALSLAEAAGRLRCPAGTIHSRLVRATGETPPRADPPGRGPLDDGHGRRGCSIPGRPRRPSLPSCAIPPPGPRSPSRPVTPPPAGRSPPPPRRWPRRSCIPCCSTSSSSPRSPCCSWPPSPPGSGLARPRSMAMQEDTGRNHQRPRCKGRTPRRPDRPRPARPDPDERGHGRAHDGRRPRARPRWQAGDRGPRSCDILVISQVRTPAAVGAARRPSAASRPCWARAESDGDGRFHGSMRPAWRPFRVIRDLRGMAAAPGYGLGRVKLNPYADQPTADIRPPSRTAHPHPAGRH